MLMNSVTEKYNMNIAPRPSVILQGFAGQTVASERSTRCNVKIMNAEARYIALTGICGKDSENKR